MQRIITTASFLTLFFIFGFSSDSFAQIIDSDELWDEDRIVNGDIEILPCVTLRITATVYMAPFRSIRVREGGTLIVNAGVITSQQFGPNQAWQGIYVEGDENAPQEECTNTGYVYIRNQSVISNSRGGIRTYRQERHATNTGGVVICENSTFINNGRSLEFFPYNFGNTASRITDCTFSINPNYLTLGLRFIGHITAWRNQGLNIERSRFGIPGFPVSQQIFAGRRGVYFLDSSGNIVDNIFSTLHVGLEVDQEGAPSGYDYITVSRNEFRYHVTGARLISENMTIEDNTFEVGSDAGGAIGLHVSESAGFTCEGNSFEGVNTVDANYGMQVSNLNAASNLNTTVSNNSFSNLNRGINCVGVNRNFLFPELTGFVVTCSDFTGNRHAIYIGPNNNVQTFQDGILQVMSPDQLKCPSNTFADGLDTDIVNATWNVHRYIDNYSQSIYTPTMSSGLQITTVKQLLECKKDRTAKFGNDSSSEAFDAAAIARHQVEEILLFPNPATTELTVALPQQVNGELLNVSQVYIMSFTGQKIAPLVRKTGNGYQVDVQELPTGMYQIIFLMEGGERLAKPFIKVGR